MTLPEQSTSLPNWAVVRGPYTGKALACQVIDGTPDGLKVRAPVWNPGRGLRYEEHWIDTSDVLEVELP